MSYLQRINCCNAASFEDYTPFKISSLQVGWLSSRFVELLTGWPDIFHRDEKSVQLNDNIKGFNERSEVVDKVIHTLVQKQIIRAYLDEPYPVTAGDRSEAIMTLDRSAVSYFGIRSFGQHLNGYVQKKNGLYLWIARRAKDRYIAPRKLDNMVAGGLPWHSTLKENLIKECTEEAGMDEALANQAKATGTISYIAESANGIKPDTLYCYDIELPEDFVPVCADGEVESFELMPVNEVMEIVQNSEDFKPNCNLVIIDFLIRHGLLDPDQAGYAELASKLHQ